MTRIEDNNNDDQVTELKGEIEDLKRKIKRKQNKKILTCGSCFLIFILLILILVGLGAYGLSQSGLAEVPFLSARFYHEPEPSYLVNTENLTPAEKDIVKILGGIVKEQILIQKKDSGFNVNLKLSEKQLTALLRDQVKNINYLNNKVDYIQLAVLPTNLELFLKTKEPKLFITLNIKPLIKNNLLDLEVENFKIGNLKLPRFAGNLWVTYLIEKNINKLLSTFLQAFQVLAVNLSSKLVIVEILIKNFKL
jgi:hypothetical protein